MAMDTAALEDVVLVFSVSKKGKNNAKNSLNFDDTLSQALTIINVHSPNATKLGCDIAVLFGSCWVNGTDSHANAVQQLPPHAHDAMSFLESKIVTLWKCLKKDA